MTAVLDPPVRPAEPPASWRQRILPLTTGRAGWLATLLVGAVGGLLRFVRLDIPRGRIFDEIYYACDAQNLLRAGVELDTVDGNASCVPEGAGDVAGFVVHPPLGKWAIAIGLRLFGTNEFGWRFAAAVAGTVTIVVLVRVALRMTGSVWLAGFAGLLLSLDGLFFVQSRVAMLDIFLAMWTTAAFACLVADRDWVRRRLAAARDEDLEGWGPSLWRRPWLLAAGGCLGAAVATKWSALYYVAVLGLLAFAWEVGARRTAGVGAPVRAVLVRSVVPLLAALVLLPVVLYVASWTGWFLAGDEAYNRNWAATNPSTWKTALLPDALRSWLDYHKQIFQFHDGLRSPHPYQSHPVGWLLLARPVSYYYPQGIGPGEYGCTVASCSREVLAIGTPAIWWVAVPALVGCLWLWVSRRDWRAAAVLVMVGAAIVPWIRDDLDQRTMFLFYALPAVPFMCLAIALCAGWALGGRDASPRRRTAAVAGSWAYLSLVVVNFAYLYPVLAAQVLSYDAWRGRMWFSSWI